MSHSIDTERQFPGDPGAELDTSTGPPATKFRNTWGDRARQSRSTQHRHIGIDLARGIAVIGMVASHVGNAPDLDLQNPASWLGVFHGRSSILFAVVAGISITLLTGFHRSQPQASLREVKLRLLGRSLALLLIGLALELLNTNIEIILCVYSVLFVAMVPFLSWSRRRLVITAVAIALVGPTLMAVLRLIFLAPSLSPGLNLLVTGSYSAFTWVPLMLAGLAIGKSALSSYGFATRLIVAGLLVGSLGYVGGAVVQTTPDAGSWPQVCPLDVGSQNSSSSQLPWKKCPVGAERGPEPRPGESSSEVRATGPKLTARGDNYFDRLASVGGLSEVPRLAWGVAEHSEGTFETLGSGGIAVAFVGVCLLVARALRRVCFPLIAIGKMPLTSYALHVVSVALLDWPFSLASDQWLDSSWFFILSVLVLAASCSVWSHFWGQGPLERFVSHVARNFVRAT